MVMIPIVIIVFPYMEISVVSAVNRIEIIDDSGRAYVKWGVDVELSYQDDGGLLKYL